jgi:hypothetical protein
MNLYPYLTSWSVLAIAVLAFAAYRYVVGSRNDTLIDLMEQDPGTLAAQNQAIRKIKTIDHWGEALTIITVAYGLVIALLYLHYVWVQGAKIPGQ